MAALAQVAQKIADWDPNSHVCIPESEFELACSAAVTIKEYLSALTKQAGWSETLSLWAYRAIAAFDSLYTIVARVSSLRGARVYKPKVFDECEYSDILRRLISSFADYDDEAAAKARDKKVAQYSFTRLPYYLPTESLLLLTRAAGADLHCAGEQLFSSAGALAVSFSGRLRSLIIELESHLERAVKSKLTTTFEQDFVRLTDFTNDMDFLTLSTLTAQLDPSIATPEDAVKVPWWDGTDRYPAFQINPVNGSVLPYIHALVHDRLQKEIFTGWHLAIWAQNLFETKTYVDDFKTLFQTELGPIGLWPPAKQDSTLVNTIISAHIAGRIDRVTLPRTLFRVTESCYQQPYYFSTGSGRYDPASKMSRRPELGAIYLARTSIGCWAEVLDRMPTVLLSDLQSKALYTIDLVDPANTKIADLTVYGDRLVNAQRDTSQKIAGRLAARWTGIEYSLRSMVSHTGVALFGPLSHFEDDNLVARRADGSTRRLHSEPKENWPIGFEARPPLLENWRRISDEGESLLDPELWKLLLQRRSLGAGQVLLLRWLPEANSSVSN